MGAREGVDAGAEGTPARLYIGLQALILLLSFFVGWFLLCLNTGRAGNPVAARMKARRAARRLAKERNPSTYSAALEDEEDARALSQLDHDTSDSPCTPMQWKWSFTFLSVLIVGLGSGMTLMHALWTYGEPSSAVDFLAKPLAVRPAFVPNMFNTTAMHPDAVVRMRSLAAEGKWRRGVHESAVRALDLEPECAAACHHIVKQGMLNTPPTLRAPLPHLLSGMPFGLGQRLGGMAESWLKERAQRRRAAAAADTEIVDESVPHYLRVRPADLFTLHSDPFRGTLVEGWFDENGWVVVPSTGSVARGALLAFSAALAVYFTTLIVSEIIHSRMNSIKACVARVRSQGRSIRQQQQGAQPVVAKKHTD